MNRLILIAALLLTAFTGASAQTDAGDTGLGAVLPRSAHTLERLLQPDTSSVRLDYASIAAEITKGCRTPLEKGYAIYMWLCSNIEYDVDYKIYDAATCYLQRKGVCAAYSRLFVALANGIGLKADYISGDSRSNPDNPHDVGCHAWVKFYTDTECRRAILADPTWGAGYVGGHEFFFRDKKDEWWNVDPSWFIFTHRPFQEQAYLLPFTITREQFENLPVIRPAVRFIGLKGRDLLARSLRGETITLPRVYGSALDNTMRFDVPKAATLQRGIAYDFVVTAPGEKTLVGQPGVKSEHRGNTSSFRVIPSYAGTLFVNIDGHVAIAYDVK